MFLALADYIPKSKSTISRFAPIIAFSNLAHFLIPRPSLWGRRHFDPSCANSHIMIRYRAVDTFLEQSLQSRLLLKLK
jgi:hypothetical protein